MLTGISRLPVVEPLEITNRAFTFTSIFTFLVLCRSCDGPHHNTINSVMPGRLRIDGLTVAQPEASRAWPYYSISNM